MVKLQKHLIVVISIISFINALLSIFSLSTNDWLSATAMLTSRVSSDVNYGLFTGQLRRQQLSATLQFDLTIYCDFSNMSACFFSCQQSLEQRETEFQLLSHGQEPESCEQARILQIPNSNKFEGNSSITKQNVNYDFIPAFLWLCTVLFAVFSTIFAAICLGFAALNLYTNPIERIFNIFGLYIWNSCTAICAILAFSLWTILFLETLNYNIAITDTLRHELTFDSSDMANLGYSYYAQVFVFLLSTTNVIILLIRRYKIQDSPNVLRQPVEQSTTLESQFY